MAAVTGVYRSRIGLRRIITRPIMPMAERPITIRQSIRMRKRR